jgi:hypothetical protein
VKPALDGAFTLIKSFAGGVINGLINAFKWFENNGVKLWQKIQDGLRPVMSGIATLMSPVLNLLNAIKGAIQYVLDKVGELQKVGGWLSGAFGWVTGHRAGGGPVSAGQAYVVGELGPELFVPTVSGSIIPGLSQPSVASASSMGSGGGGGGSTINVYVEGFLGSQSQLVEAVRRGLQDVSRRNPGALPGVA